MVIMSFNGPITYKHREYIDKIFTRRRKNPNGTPIRMTLFVSDDESQSDYCSVGGEGLIIISTVYYSHLKKN